MNEETRLKRHNEYVREVAKVTTSRVTGVMKIDADDLDEAGTVVLDEGRIVWKNEVNVETLTSFTSPPVMVKGDRVHAEYFDGHPHSRHTVALNLDFGFSVAAEINGGPSVLVFRNDIINLHRLKGEVRYRTNLQLTALLNTLDQLMSDMCVPRVMKLSEFWNSKTAEELIKVVTTPPRSS